MTRIEGRGWRPPRASAATLSLHAAVLPWLVAAPGAWPFALSALAASHAALGVLGLLPQNQWIGHTLTRLPGDPKALVSLSFDDGPDPAVTPHILNVLDRYHARASFFMIGTRAAAHPDLVQEVVRRGHEVANHTMRHPYHFACLGLRGQHRELAGAQDVLSRISSVVPRLARVPAGIRSPLTDKVLHDLGLVHVSWTRRGFDTRTSDPSLVLQRLLAGARGGDILLLHDGNAARTAGGSPVVVETLEALLPALAALGLHSVPVAQILNGAVATPASAHGAAIPAPSGYASR